jgi:predicted RNA binding protein YcfA (HicA-like mRNA interferase family)
LSRREKRLQKIRQNPKNVAFDDLHQLLQDYGFELRRVTGSHHIFEYTLGEERLKFIVPFGRPVKSYYIKEAIRIIALMAQSESEDDTDEQDD